MSARELLEHHRELLRSSAIADDVAAARGYWSATTKAHLGELGFAAYQRLAPALVVPIRDARGELVNYQARADSPRIDAERGRTVKYETVAGSRVAIDVPPPIRAELGNPERPLWVTEGARKADALVSAGEVAVALLGVWNWRGTNDRDGKVALADWELIALNGRRAFLCFDSDAMDKPSVHRALARLAALLESRSAAVRIVYLPAGDDGAKAGADDFLAAGGTVAQMRELAEDGLRPPPEPERRPPRPTADVLRYVQNLVGRHVQLPGEHELAAIALFVLHTWALQAARATPYILVASPAKRSGKTRLLEVLELAVREPLRAASVTPAALFQSIDHWKPTLLIDEVDAIFAGRRPSERTEELRGVLNAGNARGSSVVRGTQDGTPVKFSIFCPKVLAGIDNGRLPDTILDRCVVVRMERKRRGDDVARLRPAELAGQLEELRSRLEDWAAAHVEGLAGLRPSPAMELSDRLDEAWEPLFAIAELAGDPWPARARAAAIALSPSSEDADAGDHGLVLLAALRRLYGDHLALSSKHICRELNEDDELPFGAYRGGGGDGGMDPRGLSKLLRPYSIRRRTVRIGLGTAKGYHRDQFAEVWARYLDDEDARVADRAPDRSQGSQGSHPSPDGHGDVTPVTHVTDLVGADSRARVSPNGNGPRLEDALDELAEAFDGERIEPGAAPPEPLHWRVGDDGRLRQVLPSAGDGLELRGRGNGARLELTDDERERVLDAQPDRCLDAKAAAELLGVTPARLAAMWRRGELVPEVGMTPAEYRAIKDPVAPRPATYYLRSSLERHRGERKS